MGKTEVAIALAERLRADGEDPVAVSADALQVYAGLETLTGAATPGSARGSNTASSARAGHRDLQRGCLRAAAHAEIDRGWRRAGARSSWAAPGSTCARRSPTSTSARRCRRPGAVEAGEFEARGRRALHAELARRAPAAAAACAGRRPAARPRARAAEAGERAADGGRAAVDERDAPPDAARRPDDGSRGADARIERRVDAMVAAGAVEEVRAADAAPRHRARALGFAELLRATSRR